MCLPSLNKIHERDFELSCTKVKMYGGGGAMDMKPICPQLSPGDIIKFCKCKSFQVISNLLNSENLKVAIAQLCNEL